MSPYNGLPEVRRGVDLAFARIEDAYATLKKRDAPLNETEAMHIRFLIRDLAALINQQVDFQEVQTSPQSDPTLLDAWQQSAAESRRRE